MALMDELFGRPIVLPDGTVVDSSTLPEDWTDEAPEITTHSGTRETPDSLTNILATFLPGTSEEQEAMDELVLNLLSSGNFLENFDPSQARGQVGRFASGAGGMAGDVFHKVSHLEHSLKEYATDKVSSSVARLPKWLQLPVMATFHVLRAGTAVAFATWASGQALAERVAKEKGASPEQARRLRGIFTSLDVTTFKPLSLALHVSGVHAATLGAVGLLPPASACYLAYSTSRNPLATLRAARGLVRDMSARVVGHKRAEITASIAHIDDELGFVYNALSDAEQMEMGRSLEQDLKDHGYSDWYIALLSAALDEMGDAVRAVEIANEAFDQQDEDPEPEPQPDDAFQALGIRPPENTPTTHTDLENYDPNQVRDYRGLWPGTGGGSALSINITTEERNKLTRVEKERWKKAWEKWHHAFIGLKKSRKAGTGTPEQELEVERLAEHLKAIRQLTRDRIVGGPDSGDLDAVLDELAANAVAGPNPWAPYVGPRGGRGWKNTITGRVYYGTRQPGSGVSTGAPAPGMASPVGPPVPVSQPRTQRADPASVKAHIARLLADPSKITPAAIHKVKEELLSLSWPQIRVVKTDLGIKASGNKATQMARVAQLALSGSGRPPQPQAPPHAPPQPVHAPPPHIPPQPPPQHQPSPPPLQHQPPRLDVKDPMAVRAAVDAFISSKNWLGGAAGVLRAFSHGGDRGLHTIGAHLASLTGVPHHVGFDLAHTAVKELVAGLPTHPPKAPTPPTATPAQPAAAGTPSPLHRGANVITGVPGQASMALPVVPHKEEIEWSTGKPQPGTLNGIDFASAPHHFWEHVKDVDVGEPPPINPIRRAGVMVREPDGRVWIVKPTNEFGDRKYTLPGGGVEPGLTNQQNALKEVWEETGLQVKITGHLGDFRDSNNKNIGRMYIGERIGGAPWDAKIEPKIIDRKTGKPAAESSEVVLVTPERAGKLLHRTDDLAQLMTVAPIPLNTATRGRGSEPLKKLLEAVQPAAKAYKQARQSVNAVPGNAELHAIQDIRGFNAKPVVVDKKDMDDLVAKGGHIEMLRGLAADAKAGVSARRVVDTIAEQFRSGDHFPGYGIFGSGTYTDSTKGYSNIASSYAKGQRGSGGSAGATLRMAIPKTAKIVKFSELEKQVPHAPPDFKDHGPSSYNSNPDWRGIQAVLAGYDAIHMDKLGYGHDFYVILNRGVVTVQKEDATGHIVR